ncbi:MAG: DUF2931 family protein, partial [Chryseobacterium sp.]|nr:DUF2931 family protein [Candidatus Chryseobacterium enterohippi]
MKEKELPEFNVEISHPNKSYTIEFVSDKIKTIEGISAGLPYGSTSGDWGDSRKRWSEQKGTPIGADIIYFSVYEDTFYHLDVDFPKDKIEMYMQRAYAQSEVEEYNKPLKEYENLGRNAKFAAYFKPYDSFSELVFGFAPKGMVVVWLRYGGGVQIELGRYQANVVKDDKEYEKKLFASWSMNREQVKNASYIPDASAMQWDNYRLRYNWIPVISSENKGFRAFRMSLNYYNGERERILKPWISNPELRGRGIAREISFFWETGKGESYKGMVFFDWSKTNEAFKKVSTDSKLELKIAEDNNSFEVLLNGEKLSVDSMR